MNRPGLGTRRPVATEDLTFLTNVGGGPDRSTEIENLPLGVVDESEALCLRQRPFPGIGGLAAQITKHGQTTPVFVRPTDEGRFELISGYRRFAALRSINAPTILARIYRGLDDEAAYDLAVSENADRDDLTDWERALVCQRLRDAGRAAESIAKMFQWTDIRQVQNHTKLAKEAPAPLAQALQTRELRMTHALALMRLAAKPFKPEDVERVVRHAIDKALSVRAIQAYLDTEATRLAGNAKPKGGSPPEVVRVRELRSGGFSLSAKVTKDSSPEELDHVAEELRRVLKRINKLRKAADGEEE